MRTVKGAQTQVVVGVVVGAHQPFRAVRVLKHPRLEPLLDRFLLLTGGQGVILVDAPFLAAVGVPDDVIDGRAFQVEGLFQQRETVDCGPCRNPW